MHVHKLCVQKTRDVNSPVGRGRCSLGSPARRHRGGSHCGTGQLTAPPWRWLGTPAAVVVVAVMVVVVAVVVAVVA